MTELAAAPPAILATGPGAFSVTGPVTFATAGILLEAGRAQFHGHPAISMNLKEVSRVDSAGLALLLEWLRQARADGRSMTFSALPEKLLAIARLSGVDGLLTAGYLAPDSASSSGSASPVTSSR